jgi:hypothetical protein
VPPQEDGKGHGNGEGRRADLPPKYFTYERPTGGLPVGAIENEQNLPPGQDHMEVDNVEEKVMDEKVGMETETAL